MLELWGADRHEQIRLFGEQVLPHVLMTALGLAPFGASSARIRGRLAGGSDRFL